VLVKLPIQINWCRKIPSIYCLINHLWLKNSIYCTYLSCRISSTWNAITHNTELMQFASEFMRWNIRVKWWLLILKVCFY